jgi:hypothetical protein
MVAAEARADELTVNCVAEKLDEKIRPALFVFEDTMFVNVSGARTV